MFFNLVYVCIRISDGKAERNSTPDLFLLAWTWWYLVDCISNGPLLPTDYKMQEGSCESNDRGHVQGIQHRHSGHG